MIQERKRISYDILVRRRDHAGPQPVLLFSTAAATHSTAWRLVSTSTACH